MFIPLVLALPAGAQLASGTLSGTVRDISDALVRGARVTATNTSTGFERSGVTDGWGFFEMVELRAGTYEVKAEQVGFRTAVNTGVDLRVNQRARIDFTLEPGDRGQSITVAAQVSPVEAADASIGFRADSASLLRLPLLGRNVVPLVTLPSGRLRLGRRYRSPARPWSGWSERAGPRRPLHE
jgi:hypothetical protein